MATTGTQSITFATKYHLTFTWTVSSQSVATNTSTVKWTLTSDYTLSAASHVKRQWHVTINDTAYSGQWDQATQSIGSGTIKIPHESDGTATITFSFDQLFAYTINGTYVGTVSGSGTGELDQIARESTFDTLDNGVLGVSQTISIFRKSATFKQTLTYTCGSYSGAIAEKEDAESWDFVPPMQWANTEPNGDTVQATFVLQTYNGTDLVGTDTTSAIFEIPASVVPTCSLSVRDVEGLDRTFNAYVQRHSRLEIDLSVTIAYSSPIIEYRIDVDGNTYTSTKFTTPVLRNTGEQTITATVIDARGRTTVVTQDINVLEYVDPDITQVKVTRCDADGTPNEFGEYCRVTYSYTVMRLDDLNEPSAKIEYKPSTMTAWSTITLPETFEAEQQHVTFAAGSGNSYDIALIVEDLVTTSRRHVVLSTGFSIMHFAENGRAIGFGGMAESDGFHVNMDAFFNHGLNENIRVMKNGKCDNLTMSGQYYIGSAGTGKPTADNGWLVVRTFDDEAAYVYQEYITYHGVRYHRVFDTDWLPWVRDSSNDVIVEQGTAGIWTYRKWSSGVGECWGIYSGRVNASENVSQGFYHSDSILQQFPFDFEDVPMLITSVSTSGAVAVSRDSGTTTSHAVFQVLCHASGVAEDMTIGLHAIGRW